MRVRILVTAEDAPTVWDLRCFVREEMVTWVQNEMPDAAPAHRILLTEASAEAEQPKPRGKKTPPAEHASDEGLFTRSLQAVERASLLMRGQPRDASWDDAGEAAEDGDISEPSARD